MNLDELKYCPGTLAEGFSTYSPSCLRNLFSGKKVNHVLPYEQPQNSEEVAEQFMENRRRISISGVQEKLSFLLEKNALRLTKEGEQGTYILKPIPRDLKKVDQVPANEHVALQHSQVSVLLSFVRTRCHFFLTQVAAKSSKTKKKQPKMRYFRVEMGVFSPVCFVIG